MKKLKIEEGMILLQDTCDAIEIDLNGNSRRINPHTEHWIVENVTKNYVYLYNLDNQSKSKWDRENIDNIIKCNNIYGIKPLFKISKERG